MMLNEDEVGNLVIADAQQRKQAATGIRLTLP